MASLKRLRERFVELQRECHCLDVVAVQVDRVLKPIDAELPDLTIGYLRRNFRGDGDSLFSAVSERNEHMFAMPFAGSRVDGRAMRSYYTSAERWEVTASLSEAWRCFHADLSPIAGEMIDGVWLDRLFEMAWAPQAKLPLRADRKVVSPFVTSRHFPLQVFPYEQSFFERKVDDSEIQNRFGVWCEHLPGCFYSVLRDVAECSVALIDLLSQQFNADNPPATGDSVTLQCDTPRNRKNSFPMDPENQALIYFLKDERANYKNLTECIRGFKKKNGSSSTLEALKQAAYRYSHHWKKPEL